MHIRLQKSDVFFFSAVFFSFLVILHNYLFSSPMMDESFYPSVALRLINGDSLISDEWHMTQFSALFNIVPVFLFVKLSGSTSGIILYMRILYCILHFLFAFFLYRVFRNKGNIAVIASIVFMIPFYMFAVSYHTVYGLCLFGLSVFLYLFCTCRNNIFLITAGFLYGCCCVCNPLVCCIFPIYALLCLFFGRGKRLKRKSANNKDTDFIELFFVRRSLFLFFYGIAIIAAICILFFVFTNGSFSNIFDNIKMMINVSEYSSGLLQKITNIFAVFSNLSFNMPWLLPIFFLVLAIDRNRNRVLHKLIYLFFAFCLFVLYSVRILTCFEPGTFSVLLPITMFSHICYILTDKKGRNRLLFITVWVPGVVGAVFQLFGSRSTFVAFGGVVLPAAFAGVFFVSELIKELFTEIKTVINKGKRGKKIVSRASVGILVVTLCFQFVFQTYCSVNYYEWYAGPKLSYSDSIYVTDGPLKGTLVSKEYSKEYNKMLADLDYISLNSEENDAVLILSHYSWPYLYLNRPSASYSSWGEIVNVGSLENYYIMNPDKIPKYIYISNDYYSFELELELRWMIECHKTHLENGVLFIANG